MQLTAACIQTTSISNIDANTAAIAPMVQHAAEQGAQFVALPENVFFMREGGDGAPHYFTMANHPGVAAAQDWAARHRLWLLVGSVAVCTEDPQDRRRHNRSVMIDPQGNISAFYDKIHLFDVDVGDGQRYCESEHIMPGGGMCVANIPMGGINIGVGCTICYDLRFPQLFRALAKAGASIITVPSAFTAVTGEAHWHVLLRARAIETGSFIIAPGQCGTHPGGRKTYGHSLIVDPWGKVLADGGTEPGVVMATLNLDEVERVRKRMPSLQHDREF